MPIFEAATPLTRAQKRRRWIAGGVIVAAGLTVAVWSAVDCAGVAFGYVASYSYAGVFFMGGFLVLAGAPLTIYWRTRSTGVTLACTGVGMYLVFVGSMGSLKRFDKLAWMHEPPMVAFGPDQQASVVIYYRAGTSGKQIEDFVEHKIDGYPSKIHPGTDMPDFVTEYAALIPEQANGYDGSTLTFRPGVHGADVDSFVNMIQSDARVARVFRDVAPDAIHLPKAEQVPLPKLQKSQ